MSSVDDARLILASGLLTLVFVKVFSNIGLPFLAVWAYGVHRKWLQLTRESYIVAYFAVTGFLTLVPVAGNYLLFVVTIYGVNRAADIIDHFPVRGLSLPGAFQTQAA